MRGTQLQQHAQHPREHAEHQHRLVILLAQAVGDPPHPGEVAGGHRPRQVEGDEAGAVAHRLPHLGGTDAPAVVEQRKLVHLLRGGEEIALGPLGEQRQRLLVRLQAPGTQPPGEPAGKLAGGDRPRMHVDPGTGEGLHPGAAALARVDAGGRHDQQRIRRRIAGILLECGTAVTADLAVRAAQLHQPAAAEQRQAAGGLAQTPPVETGLDLEHLALVEAGRAGGLADLRQGFLDEQGLVAGEQVHRREPGAQLAGELLRAQLGHSQGCPCSGDAAASRASISRTASTRRLSTRRLRRDCSASASLPSAR